MTYSVLGASSETSVPLHHAGGWTDLKAPGYVKALRKVYCFYDSPDATGTLTLKFNALEYDTNTRTYVTVTDTFDINLTTNPQYYTAYFTDGALMGEQFKLDITEDSLNDIKIDKIIVVYDVDPLV